MAYGRWSIDPMPLATSDQPLTAMRSVVVGTAGHIDHGKSALVRALTGTDPDRLKEEKARGITIDLGFAHQVIGDINFAFVDATGRRRIGHRKLVPVATTKSGRLYGSATIPVPGSE